MEVDFKVSDDIVITGFLDLSNIRNSKESENTTFPSLSERR
jgi:hypothetical protein